MECKYCGKKCFDNTKSLNGHIARCREYKKYISSILTEEFLIVEYINNSKSAIEISQSLGFVSASPIIRHLKIFNIPVRNISQSCGLDRKQTKVKQTNLKKYGVENVLSKGSPIRDKMEINILKKYGVKNVRQIPSVINKITNNQMETKYKMGLAVRPELHTEWTKYKNSAINLANRTYRKYDDIINPSELTRGRNEYHLDHKLSIKFGFENNIPIEIISHISNLCMLEESVNISKRSSCSITLDQLYKRIEEYEYLEDKEYIKN